MNHLILTCCLVLTTIDAIAETGRLFFTPAERARLDELRSNAKSVELTNDPNAIAAPVEIAPPSDVSVQGYVKRSDGKKGTVWVNGQPVQENSSGAGVEVGKLQGSSNQVPVTLPSSGKSLKLKAGQVYSPSTDSVSEVRASTSSIGDPVQAGTIGDSPSPTSDKPTRP